MVKPLCLNFRVITPNILGVRKFRTFTVLEHLQYLLPVVGAVAVEAILLAGDQPVAPGNRLGMVHSGMWVGWLPMTGPDLPVPSYHRAVATDPLGDPLGPAGVGVQASQCVSLAGLVAGFVRALAWFPLALNVALHACTQPTEYLNNT